MKLLTKLCAVSALTLTCTLFVFAQTATPAPTGALGIRPQPGSDLNGSVAISSSTVALSNSIVSGSFSATSNVGNADTVYYGLVMRDRVSGQLIDVSPTFGKLMLAEHIPQTVNLSYTLPNVYGTSTDVYLNLANAAGTTLGSLPVGSVATAATSSLCKVTANDATCVAPQDSVLAISVYDRGPQGDLVGTTTVPLSAKQTVKITFEDLLKNFQNGHYFVSVALSSSGDILDSFAKDYWKAGPYATIVGTTLVHATDSTWNATVYTDVSGYDASSTFSVTLTPSCGTPVQVPITLEGVETSSLTFTCSSGYVTALLLKDGTPASTVYQSFSLPQVPTKDMTTQILVGLASLIAIALGLIFYIVHKHHHALLTETVATPNMEVMPQNPSAPAPTPEALKNPEPVPAVPAEPQNPVPPMA